LELWEDEAYGAAESKKVKLSLSLTKHYAMKTYGGVCVKIHGLLTSALVAGEWSVSRPGSFTREKGFQVPTG
jgi:hypothetical protein